MFSTSIVRVAAAAVAILLVAVAAQAADPAALCEAGKLKASGKYASCRLAADGKGVLDNLSPDYSKCDPSKRWTAAETKGAGMCPNGTDDEAGVQAFLDGCSQSVVDALAGTVPLPPLTPSSCTAALATCTGNCVASVRPPLRTGQTICYNDSGAVIACPGTGQDGALQNGAARSFTDNGDGTITDNVTGLMWEKLSDDGSIHAADNLYTWSDAFAVKVATLNSTSFAGYNDWRLPNAAELQTLVNFGAGSPATHSAFHTGCVPTCTVLTCSCTVSYYHWSSSTYESFPSYAWWVNFYDGYTLAGGKTTGFSVRAVRAGS